MDGLLKFITCGSVDDGKSTLIGHMLYDAKLIFADQENALVLDSKVGSRDGDIDYSLLLDGLMAEREQGITIDVAYRFFNTEKRSFIVADTPGHEEYTRNMAVGASFADLAVILVDASKGLLPQTRRHTRICALMGIRHFVFTVNKMDLVDYDERTFQEISLDIQKLMLSFDHDSLMIMPVSATEGDNITAPSAHMPWYKERPLLTYLEEVDASHGQQDNAFVMPVQRVSRPNADFRGFQGQPVSGKLAVGDEITILPSGEKAVVSGLMVADKTADTIFHGQPVTILPDREADISRGCVLVGENSPLRACRTFRAEMLWMDDTDLVEGRGYMLKLGTKLIPATVMKIHYCVDVNTGAKVPPKEGRKNDILNCDISLSEKIVLSPFSECQEMGRFILINRVTNMTSACGVIRHTLRRSDNLTWQNLDVTRQMRSQMLDQKPVTYWFTGLSGAGKSTIANALEKALASEGRHTMLLDGDNLRMGLNKNLGFTEDDRVENIRRIAEVAKLMNDAGLIVLVAAISPFAGDRQAARNIIGDAFREIYVETSLEECERRDTKGLYRKAREGSLPNFTGIGSPYEVPEHAELTVHTESQTLEEIVEQILEQTD